MDQKSHDGALTVAPHVTGPVGDQLRVNNLIYREQTVQQRDPDRPVVVRRGIVVGTDHTDSGQQLHDAHPPNGRKGDTRGPHKFASKQQESEYLQDFLAIDLPIIYVVAEQRPGVDKLEV